MRHIARQSLTRASGSVIDSNEKAREFRRMQLPHFRNGTTSRDGFTRFKSLNGFDNFPLTQFQSICTGSRLICTLSLKGLSEVRMNSLKLHVRAKEVTIRGTYTNRVASGFRGKSPNDPVNFT